MDITDSAIMVPLLGQGNTKEKRKELKLAQLVAAETDTPCF